MALRSDEVVMPGGRVATREILEHPGAVAIAALDEDDRLMMIYQYRHALERRLWEMPAGLLDVAGEPEVETAKRELAAEVHPFFVGTQAHPELKSRPTRPHPLFAAFVRAAIDYRAADRLPVELHRERATVGSGTGVQ